MKPNLDDIEVPDHTSSTEYKKLYDRAEYLVARVRELELIREAAEHLCYEGYEPNTHRMTLDSLEADYFYELHKCLKVLE